MLKKNRGATFESRDAINLSKSSNPEKWKRVTFYLFDAPNIKDTFEKRMEYLNNLPLPSPPSGEEFYPKIEFIQYLFFKEYNYLLFYYLPFRT